jgi:spermidine synthase
MQERMPPRISDRSHVPDGRVMRSRSALLLPLFLISGACDLVYEVAWGRALGVVFGVSVFAITAVLASFMFGLALGGVAVTRFARALSRPAPLVAPGPDLDPAPRPTTPTPVAEAMRLFSRLHLGIGLSAAATLLFLPVVRALYLVASRFVDADSWGIRPVVLLLAVLLLIVPTALMGATFPVASRILEPAAMRLGRDIGALYAVGTFGSILGCVVAVLLLPIVGLRGTILTAALADLGIGFLALRSAASVREASEP